MPVGQGVLSSFHSYLAVGRETTTGTYNTCTAGLDFISAAFKVTKELKTLEQVETRRSYSKFISLGKVVAGEVEFYANAESAAMVYMLQNALGGTLTSATSTGETIGSTAMEHTINFGNLNSADMSYTSLCFNHRKGDSSGGMVFQYSGAKVNELMFTAEIDEALKCSASMICIDATKTSNDVSSVLNVNTNQPLSFVNGRVSVESSFSSLTSTSFWHVQSVEFGISNNLKADSASRRIGSDVLQVLPPGMANFTLNMTMRFDTTTAFDAMLAATQLTAELEFTGTTLSGSKYARSMKFQFPKIIVADAGDPEVSGPDEILSSEIQFAVFRDDSSNTGYPLRAIVRNLTASY